VKARAGRAAQNGGRVMDPINLTFILLAAFIASASPGPATLSIADTSMREGRKTGLALAAGITTGSLMWSVAASLGLGALMLANAWIFELIRYVGAAYLMFLALKSAKSALRPDTGAAPFVPARSLARAYLKGLALHLTNPKAILFFGSLYAIGLSPAASATDLMTVIAAVGAQSFVIFHGYALLFSNARISRGYVRIRRWLDAAFALAFGVASLKVLTARV
jgi:threonine efflux protein